MISAMTRRGLLAAGTTLAIPGHLAAQSRQPSWADRPVRIVVGYSPGGTTDLIARAIAPVMMEALGQPVVVENRAGAAGNLATEYVIRAPADGHVLLVSSGGQITVSPHTYPGLRFEPLGDLTHITMIGEGDQIVCTGASLPVRSFAEFVDLAKRQPGKMSYATSGAGGNLHLFLEFLRMETGIEIEAIHYRGGSTLLPDLINNQVQLSLSTFPVVDGSIRSGQVRPLLIVGRKREPRLPDVPTATEAGYPALDACVNWFGLHGPKGLPQNIVTSLHNIVGQALRQNAVKERLAILGIDPVGDSPEEFLARMRREHALYGQVARRANVTVE
jgi:tripartite-type tricarboxylate transporter receptor subunit TctC